MSIELFYLDVLVNYKTNVDFMIVRHYCLGNANSQHVSLDMLVACYLHVWKQFIGPLGVSITHRIFKNSAQEALLALSIR